MIESVLLDSSFLIGLVNPKDAHHENAVGYWKYFLEQEARMYLSTIVLSEFSSGHSITDFPILRQLIPIPFSYREAVLAGTLKAQKIAHDGKLRQKDDPSRVQIKDDIKIIAQLLSAAYIQSIATSDSKMRSVFDFSCGYIGQSKSFLDISIPYERAFNLQTSLF